MEAQELEQTLAGFTGTEKYHAHNPVLFKGFVLTDGAADLREHASNGAYWLFDAIASYQPQLRRVEFQSWKLKVNLAKHSAVLTCEDGNGKVKVTQKIEFTDFPLAEQEIWVEPGECGGEPVMVALLVSEH